MIERHIEKVIEKAVNHFPVVIVTGPRQVGKSTLLRNTYEPKGYSYVSLDDVANRALALNDPRTFLSMYSTPLIIDEAQKAPELFVELERIVNEARIQKGNKESSGMYILTGSTHHTLLENAEESLAGRCSIISMWPLSLSEILNRSNQPLFSNIQSVNQRSKDSNIKLDDIYEYITRGFLPLLYDDPDVDASMFYSAYVTTYLEKDLKDILKVKDELKFINFMKLLASNIGQELIYDNYSKDIGVTSVVVKTWVSALVKTGIVYLVQPYNEQSIKKRIVKRPKIYFFDTGLAAHLVGIDSPKTMIHSFMKGRFFENAAMNEIVKSFVNAGINQSIYYYRDSNNNEVDLVYVQEGKLHLVEMKAGTSFNLGDISGFKQLEQTSWKKGENAIVCTTELLSALEDNTFILPITSI